MELNPEAVGFTIGALVVGLGSGAAATHKIIKRILLNDVVPKGVDGICPAPNCHAERVEVAKEVTVIAEKIVFLKEETSNLLKITTENAKNLEYIRGRIDEALKK